MYVVTNRRIYDEESGLDKFGKRPADRVLNEKGSNELRLLEVVSAGKEGEYNVKLLKDKLSRKKLESLKAKHSLEIDTSKTWFSSLDVACKLMARARKDRKHILLYVHGYNNDMGDIVETAERMEALYKVIVVIFSWPANGGGTGAVAYLSDKKDARSSCDALNTCIQKLDTYHRLLTEGWQKRLWKEAVRKFPDNPSAAQGCFAELLSKDCKVSLNLLCHSMGNYLLKKSVLATRKAPAKNHVFDNISLVAADANNEEHQGWVESLDARRVYVVINENDYALSFSRLKPGDQQLPRLGHWLKNLTASNSSYIDVTDATGVGCSHSYFHWELEEDEEKRKKQDGKMAGLKTLFKALFEGGIAEDKLCYRPDLNAYRLSSLWCAHEACTDRIEISA